MGERPDVGGCPVDEYTRGEGCREPRDERHGSTEDPLDHLGLALVGRTAVGAEFEAELSDGKRRGGTEKRQNIGRIGNSQVGRPPGSTLGEREGARLGDTLERKEEGEHEGELDQERSKALERVGVVVAHECLYLHDSTLHGGRVTSSLVVLDIVHELLHFGRDVGETDSVLLAGNVDGSNDDSEQDGGDDNGAPPGKVGRGSDKVEQLGDPAGW